MTLASGLATVIREALEPGVVEAGSTRTSTMEVFAASQAISLKRIADVLENVESGNAIGRFEDLAFRMGVAFQNGVKFSS